MPAGDPAPDDTADEYVYGPAFGASAHLLNVVAGNEPLGEVSGEYESAKGRHIASAILALLTACVAGLALFVLTGSRLVGLWTAAALLSVPLWTGMGFFNPKDTPVAAGFTSFTVGLILALRRRDRGWRPDLADLPVLGLTAAGVFLAVGTRLAMWVPLSVSALAFLALCLQMKHSGYPGRYRSALAGSLLGLVCVIVLYPSVFADPLGFVSGTVNDSSEYAWSGVTLTAGELLSEEPSWWYLPAWSFASIPLLIGAVSICGAFFAGRTLWGRIRARERAAIGLLERGTALILLQLLLLPLASIAAGSTMYSGLRQHLYMLPAIAMLAGIGAFRLLGWRQRTTCSRITTWLTTAGLSVALLVPMVEQIRLFPYNYVYVNPVAGIGGVDDRWEGDYWWASLKEASEEVPVDETAYCAGINAEKHFPVRLIAPCADLYRPYAKQSASATSPAAGNRLTLLQRRGGGELPDACEPVGAITRKLRGETLVMSYIARC